MIRPTAFLSFLFVIYIWIGGTGGYGQIKLSTGTTEDTSLRDIRLTPDGARIIFNGDYETDGVSDVFSLSTRTSGPPLKLSDNIAGTGDVNSIVLSPDGSLVAYNGDLTTLGQRELFVSSTTEAGTQIKLTSTPVSGAGVQSSMEFTPDGRRVIFLGDLTQNDRVELYSAISSARNTQLRLNAIPVSGGGVASFQIHPDEDWVLYRGDLTEAGTMELYRASTQVSLAQVKLSTTPVAGGGIKKLIGITADGTRALYRGDFTTDTQDELYSVSIANPGSQIRINTTPPMDGDVLDAVLPKEDSMNVVFWGDLTNDDVLEIYGGVTAVAGSQVKLNDTPVFGGDVYSIVGVFPDGSRVVYRGDLDRNGTPELYSAPTTEVGSQIKLNDAVTSQINGVRRAFVSPDTSKVVFLADLEIWGKDELYCASTTEEGTQIKLTNFPNGVEIGDVDITPDSKQVVFRARTENGDSFWSVAIDGRSAPKALTSENDDYETKVSEFRLPSGSRRAFFKGNLAGEDLEDFFAVAFYDPTVSVKGKRKIRTSSRRVRIKGTARHDLGISQVQFRSIGRKISRAKGTTNWKARVKLKRRRTPVRFQSFGRDGQVSGLARVTVIRR